MQGRELNYRPHQDYLPAGGTPIMQFANVDPSIGANLCPDLAENKGRYFGPELSAENKYARKEFLKAR
jgi:hypothetical protein